MSEQANATGSDHNQLIRATSPYLLQHAANPVHWQVWSSSIFDASRASGKPILLSIGYASCHWCHVMAHESFEDPATATLMNTRFICVKVDREERPDIDHLYMSALHALGEQGGWPLTMFLDASGAPFWGGTYFPPEPRHGRPSFRQVLTAISAAYNNEQREVARISASLSQAVRGSAVGHPPGQLDPTACMRLAEAFVRRCDPVHGGLAGAPKFPNIPIFSLFWRLGVATHRQDLYNAVHDLLRGMSLGGIFDQLAGGFARYSTDELWLVPHFEKMLYDNALALDLLSSAHALSPNSLYAHAAGQTCGWLLREMRVTAADAAAAFAASQDADAAGEEGITYTWTHAEIDAILAERSENFKRAYDVTEAGNWEGRSILHLARPTGEEIEAFAQDRARLLTHRQHRPRPDRDETVLADWNGLAIVALARAAAVFRQTDWLAASRAAYSYIMQTLFTNSAGVAHAARQGRVTAPGLLDDQASMACAALALHEATGDQAYLADARALVQLTDALYAAPDGRFYLTSIATDDLPTAVLGRPFVVTDAATPSGNGMMAEALARLYLLTGEDSYRQRCDRLVDALCGGQAPAQTPSVLAAAFLLANGGTVEVIGDDDQATELLDAARAVLDPTLCIVHRRVPLPAEARVCRANVCGAPVHTVPDLIRSIRS